VIPITLPLLTKPEGDLSTGNLVRLATLRTIRCERRFVLRPLPPGPGVQEFALCVLTFSVGC
jgi:hypothetical protein